MHLDGPCLFLVVREGDDFGPDILPIWPVGFAAVGGMEYGILLTGPIGKAKNVSNVELMEIHGQYIDKPPADAVVPPDCLKYPLFLVGRVANIS
jgi:hypothetical protein